MAYEQLDQPEKARDAFAYFLQWFSNASLPYQPLVAYARQALARIEAELD